MVNEPRLRELCREVLIAIGEDPDQPGLVDTPRRWAAAWVEFIQYDPGKLDTTFESVQTDQMVVVSNIPVWSKCQHHLEAFSAMVSVAYVTHDRVLGLSKFARVVHRHAHRLQLQEQLCQDVADELEQLTGSPDVAVLAHGQHLCMVARGIKSPATMTSSVMRGAFRTKPEARAEFLALTRA